MVPQLSEKERSFFHNEELLSLNIVTTSHRSGLPPSLVWMQQSLGNAIFSFSASVIRMSN